MTHHFSILVGQTLILVHYIGIYDLLHRLWMRHYLTMMLKELGLVLLMSLLNTRSKMALVLKSQMSDGSCAAVTFCNMKCYCMMQRTTECCSVVNKLTTEYCILFFPIG